MVDGDQLMALIALSQHGKVRSRGAGIVATVMSNLGLERKLGRQGLDMHRHRSRRPLRAGGDARHGPQRRAASNRAHHSLPTMPRPGDGLVAGLQILAAIVDPGPARQRACSMCSSRCRNCSRMSAFNGGTPPGTGIRQVVIAGAKPSLVAGAAGW
jgi:phosphoglucosamine mutase